MTDYDSGRISVLVRSPDADKPELLITISPPDKAAWSIAKPLSFDALRLLTRQCQEALMRYPVIPRPTAA